MSLFSLPNELFIQVGEELDPKDLAHFISTSHRIAAILTPILHKIAVHTRIAPDNDTVFMWAAEEGHVKLLNSLLGHGSDMENHNHFQWTPLMAAARKGQVAVIKFLLSKGAKMSAEDPEGYGYTALHCAVMEGQVEAARVLLENGADIEARISDGRTPLHEAVVNTHGDCARLLLEMGADVNAVTILGETPLLQLAKDDNRVDREIESQGNGQCEEQSVPEGPGETLDQTPQEVTVKAEIPVLAIVQLLLDNGASIHPVNNCSEAALHYAAGNGYKEVVKILLESAVDVDSRDIYGCTPLLWAARGSYKYRYDGNDDHIEVMRLLLGMGANLDLEDWDARTVRFWGSSGNTGLNDFLEEMGQDVEELRAFESDLEDSDAEYLREDPDVDFEWEDYGEDENDNDVDSEEISWDEENFE